MFRSLLPILLLAACAGPARVVPLDLDAANPDADETPARAPLTPYTAVAVPAAEPVKAHPPDGEGHVCPMHPEVKSATPGKCPKCGMNLVVPAPATQQSEGYVCPMHPEVQSATPGKCPKCGMNLVPK